MENVTANVHKGTVLHERKRLVTLWRVDVWTCGRVDYETQHVQ
jgi:hypothetical protein